ncbi:putative toxin-antitoxin system toxin component, PIN family [Leucothrix pacifica]|uniref:Putative toxin-antitoxin system toxin component, PIN family n=1 Tax=Leucothrix pacifica TaxID=1247513 RepID=A0A317CR50_9GAMM|nr:putative toxin-antitoxin system toxin component, PIN family [Leucothrix pacifica]PWR00572.1 putative toxin-antitoxin system toxin component, PIN family [Leucothrix pacifica]
MKVIVDTNILVAALLGNESGAARKILELSMSDVISPLVGEALFNEYMDILDREDVMQKCPLNGDERLEFLSAFLSCCQWCKIYFGWRPNLRDEGDNHLIELAIAGGAQYIITSNVRDLKNGELAFDGLSVVTPQQFMKESPWV